MLHCSTCQRPHDLDQGPDEGVCLACGGPLVEGLEDVPDHGTAIVQVVADGLAAAGVARGKTSCGSN